MQAAALTDRGLKRKVNQDCIFASTAPVGGLPNLFILADGMGGARGGDYASSSLKDIIVGDIQASASGDVIKVMRKAIERANREIYRKSLSDDELSGMGSTLVAAVIKDKMLYTANVGDSRLYLIHDGIWQVTRDHSYVDELLRSGLITRDSEEYRRNKNIITRAVGAQRNVHADFFERELVPGDMVLLCSDGLTNMVDDDTILAILSGSGSIRYKASSLINEANSNGGNDNIAVILVRYEEGD